MTAAARIPDRTMRIRHAVTGWP